MWLGKKEMPEQLQKCMESWEKYCPDYEIIRWDESNYDVYKNIFLSQAYYNKKYGFVPDFARLDILYNYGGIYLEEENRGGITLCVNGNVHDSRMWKYC